MKIIVSVKELKAALLFASEDESRYNLCGVCLEVRPKCAPLLISTDGRRMAVIETLAQQEEEFDSEAAFILNRDFVNGVFSLSKIWSIKLFPLVVIEAKTGSKRVLVHFKAGKSVLDCEEGALIEGLYPNWRAVIPSGDTEPVNELGLNAEFVGDFSKASKLLEAESPVIQMYLHSREGVIQVRISGKPNFYGCVMPTKLFETEYQPEFLGLEKASKAA